MKRTLFVILLLTVCICSNAQFRVGGNFSIYSDKLSIITTAGEDMETTYQFSVKPSFFWSPNEKMQVGGRVGFTYGNINSGYIFDSYEEKSVLSSQFDVTGWCVNPAFLYRLGEMKKVSLWLEANAYVGQLFNVQKYAGARPETDWGRQTQYGFEILPVFEWAFNEKSIVQIHLGVVSLGWMGSKSVYSDNKIETDSTWDLHKGSLSDLLKGFYDYGIGLIRRF